MTVPITDFIPLVAPEVMGCPQVMMKAKIVQAVINLCKQAPIWIHEHANITTVAGTRDYTFTPPAGSAVADIQQILHDGDPLDPAHIDYLHELYADWRSESGTPLYYTRMADTALTLIPIPDTVATVKLIVTLKPLSSITAVEDFIYNNHSETVAAGAKAILMMMPEQKWSNAPLAAYYQSEFDSGVADAAITVARGRVSAPIRVRPCV